MSSWGPGPARRVAWVDADHGTQVIKLVANATQIPAVQWIPACAGMTIEKNHKIKELKNLSSRGPGPARRVAWVDADRGTQVMRLLCASTDNIFVIASETKQSSK